MHTIHSAPDPIKTKDTSDSQVPRLHSAQAVGLTAHIISVEVDLFNGFHTFSIVGLPDKAIEESKDRVSSAIKSVGFKSPKNIGKQKVVVALAPADLKKEGPIFDLPIALGYLLAKEKIYFNPKKKLFLGELSLGGELRPIKGALLLVEKAKKQGFEEVYLPRENANEASFVKGITIYGVKTLKEIISHLNKKELDEETQKKTGITNEKLSAEKQRDFSDIQTHEHTCELDFNDIRGQENAKRGLEIAAAGGHNVAFFGPPGTGKTLLAKALAGILPPLSLENALEVTGIYGTVGKVDKDLMTIPPFRAPHHTSSHTSIIGGGSFPKPGEITFSHRGVLFLDEFPEFDRRVIEALRQPLEEGTVSIARAKGSETFPAEFILVAAFNPCPCGYYRDKVKECSCTPSQLMKYHRKISGPIIDRIDIWVEVPRVEHKKLTGEKTGEESKFVRARVKDARGRQEKRYADANATLNSGIGVKEIETYMSLSQSVTTLLEESAKKLDLSARSYHRTIKLARTIADLDHSGEIKESHILEALQYRPKQFVY
ncbi:magnesium chelatase [bacterium]|nr:magnesium chelatase [bacterium]|tara:strand:- start:17442 stop:19073 length:1632 start_codon:yes stop_codon:yes gene_type:complete